MLACVYSLDDYYQVWVCFFDTFLSYFVVKRKNLELIFGAGRELKFVTNREIHVVPSVHNGLAIKHFARDGQLLAETFALLHLKAPFADIEVHLVYILLKDRLVRQYMSMFFINRVTIVRFSQYALNIRKHWRCDLACCVQPRSRSRSR